jgi:hypothetical protein
MNAYVCVTPRGRVMVETTRTTAAESKREAVLQATYGVRWEQLAEQGYRCLPCDVVPDWLSGRRGRA